MAIRPNRESQIQRPIIPSMLRFNQGPLNVRVSDREFFRAVIESRPPRVRILVERKDRFVDVGTSNVVYDTPQQGTGLPRTWLLQAHQEWIIDRYGDQPEGEQLIIEHGDEPFSFVLRDPGLIIE